MIKKLQYRIKEVATIKIFSDGFNEKFKKSLDVKKQGFGYELETSFNTQEKINRVDVVGDVKIKIDKENPTVVANIIAVVIFEVQNLSDIAIDGKLPEGLNDTLTQITIGTLRGILSAHSAGTPIALFPLPIVDVKTMTLVKKGE